MKIVRFRFTPIVDDYLAWVSYNYFRSAGYLAFGAVALVLSLWGIRLVLTTLNRPDLSLWLRIVPILITLYFPGYLFYVFVWRRYTMRKRIEQDEQCTAEVTGEATDEYLLLKNEFGESKLGWRFYHRLIETQDYFFLVLRSNRARAQIIPKDAFESDEDELHLRQLIQRSLESSAKA